MKPKSIIVNGKEISFDKYMFFCRLCEDYDSEKHYCNQRKCEPELYIHCSHIKYTELVKYFFELIRGGEGK